MTCTMLLKAGDYDAQTEQASAAAASSYAAWAVCRAHTVHGRLAFLLPIRMTAPGSLSVCEALQPLERSRGSVTGSF